MATPAKNVLNLKKKLKTKYEALLDLDKGVQNKEICTKYVLTVVSPDC